MDRQLSCRAQAAMRLCNPDLVDKFVLIVAFLHANQELAQPARKTELFSDEYLAKHASSFAASRTIQAPSEPSTIPDEMVKFVLEKYWDIDPDETVVAADYHNKAMGAENIIGHLLERYIASTLEPEGWVWCSGSVAKAIDFIYQDDAGDWCALQIKNRDNSENSSSKRVRDGTNILHWFRTFSRKAGDNWRVFPISDGFGLSEIGFREFVADYLTVVKNQRRK